MKSVAKNGSRSGEQGKGMHTMSVKSKHIGPHLSIWRENSSEACERS